jgi:hypothetical protein
MENAEGKREQKKKYEAPKIEEWTSLSKLIDSAAGL